MKRGGLGRGLDVLLPQSGELLETVVRDISIDEIDPNASQPRRDFDKEALEQLADSIREAGVLSPILVVENDMAKVLGQALAARMDGPLLCLDGVGVENGDYIDIGAPVAGGAVLPVVIKTLAFQKE